jgi:hypothetical protein
MKYFKYFVRNGLGYLLALLMVANPTVLQELSALAQQPAKPVKKETAAKPRPEDLKRKAAEMERAFKALEAAEKEIPRDTFDPKAIVEKVGRDPVKLFEWVRDNTYWVPYRGSLRGPIGVLMDRLGSSLDRALLLAELLRTAGHKVRLASAELTEAQAKGLLPKLRAVHKDPLPAPPATSQKNLDQLIEKYSKHYQFDAAEVRKNMEKASLKASKLAEDLVQRVADQAPKIANAIGKPTEEDAQALHDRDAAAKLEALRDHWWVQRQYGAAWVDLDPLLCNAEPGKTLAKATETITPDKKSGKLVLGSEFCHEIRIRIVIEQWKKIGFTEKIVLDHIVRPSDSFGEPIALYHIPMQWPRDFDVSGNKVSLQKKLTSAVLAEREWTPVLRVGPVVVTDLSFTDSGDTNTAELSQLAAQWGFRKAAGGIEKILKTGGIGKVGRGKSPAEKPKTDGLLTAEWAEYEIRVPGQRAQKIRRQVFDLLGPAALGG